MKSPTLNDMTIDSRPFCYPPGRYMRRVATMWLLRWWWALALPLAALVLMGLWDSRFFIVASMCLFLVYPGVMASVYINNAFRPWARIAVLSKTVSVSGRGVDIVFQPMGEGAAADRPVSVPFTDIAAVEDTGGSYVVYLRNGRYDFLEIPVDAFDAADIKAISVLFDGLMCG